MEQRIDQVIYEKSRNSVVYRFLKISIVLFLLFVNMITLLFASPAFNQSLLNSFTRYVSDRTGFNVAIENLKLDLNDGIALKNVRILDKHNDTLINAQSINTSILRNLFPMIFSKKYNFSVLKIDGSKIKILKKQGDSLSNIEEFIQNLQIPKSKDNSCTRFSLKKAQINNSELVIDEFDKNTYYNIKIVKSLIDFKRFDNCRKVFEVEKVFLSNPVVSIIKRNNTTDIGEISDSTPFQFPLNINVKSVEIEDGRFVMISNSQTIKKRIDLVKFSDLDISDITLNATDIELNDSLKWTFKLNQLSFAEKSGFKVENLSFSEALITDRKIELKDLDVETGNSFLNSNLKLVYNDLKDFKNFSDDVYFSINFKDSYLTISDLAYFIDAYQERTELEKLMNGKIGLNGKVNGYINDFRTDKIDINIEDQLTLSSDIQCKNVSYPEQMFFNINNLKLNSTTGFIKELFPKINLTDRFLKFGTIDFNGSFFGHINEFTTQGKLATDIGNADVDIYMNIKDKNKNIRYNGKLQLNNFELGDFLDQKNVGKIGGKFVVTNGTNITPENINADFKANIDSVEFKNYKYRNLKVDGSLKEKTFNGHLVVNDLNFDLNLDGKIDYQSSVPVFNFKAQIQDADLKALKLYNKSLFLNSDVAIDIIGSKAEDFIGKIKATNLEISNGMEIATLDSISVYSALNKKGERYLDGDSDILSFYFDGKYKFSELKNSVVGMIDRHFAKFLTGVKKANVEKPEYRNYYYNYNFSIYNSENFFRVLTGKPFKAVNLSFDGSAYHKSDSIKMSIKFDSLIYDNYAAVRFDSDFNLYQGYGDFKLNTEQLVYKKTVLGNVTFNSDVDKDELYFHTNIDAISNKKNSISFSGKTVPHLDSFEIQLYGGYISLLDNSFEFGGNNRMILAKDYIRLHDFNLNDNETSILIEDTNNNKGVRLKIDQLNAKFVNLLLKDSKLKFSGRANAFIEVPDIFKPELFESQIDIPDLAVNGNNYGAFHSNLIIEPSDKEKIKWDAIIGDEKPIVMATGNYNLKQKTIFGDFTVNDFPVSFLKNIIQEGVSDMQGVIDGNLIVKGPAKEYNISGNGLITNGAAKVDFLGSKYFCNNQKFTLNNKGIDLKGVILSDSLGNQGEIVSGGITYTRFKKWGVDVQMSSDKIMSLNTNQKLNPDFWGFAVGKTKASFKGLFEDVINMDIDITTGAGSNLTIPVKLYVDTIGGSFIKFRDTTKVISPVINPVATGKFQLELYVNVTEDATVTIIMDENTGDYVRGKGSGIIRMVMDKDKNFDVYGDYKFSEGNYVFKYELMQFGIVNKEFAIRPGSHIFFSGDIYGAEMDIKADYHANRISLKNLLKEFNLGDNANYNYTADVDLILLLTGTLKSPQINFDFKFDNIDERIKSIVFSKIQKLKSDPNAVYTQAVSLLTFVTFVPDQSLNETFQNETFLNSGIAGSVNTISELIANQLSQYVTGLLREVVVNSKLISDVDFSFSPMYNTELNSGVLSDAQHFNMNATLWFNDDKIYVHFGGDYNYLDNNTTTPKSNYFSQGNVDIGYIVTSDKRLKVKLSFKTEFNELKNIWENKGGIGVSYGKEFGKVLKNN